MKRNQHDPRRDRKGCDGQRGSEQAIHQLRGDQPGRISNRDGSHTDRARRDRAPATSTRVSFGDAVIDASVNEWIGRLMVPPTGGKP